MPFWVFACMLCLPSWTPSIPFGSLTLHSHSASTFLLHTFLCVYLCQDEFGSFLFLNVLGYFWKAVPTWFKWLRHDSNDLSVIKRYCWCSPLWEVSNGFVMVYEDPTETCHVPFLQLAYWVSLVYTWNISVLESSVSGWAQPEVITWFCPWKRYVHTKWANLSTHQRNLDMTDMTHLKQHEKTCRCVTCRDFWLTWPQLVSDAPDIIQSFQIPDAWNGTGIFTYIGLDLWYM